MLLVKQTREKLGISKYRVVKETGISMSTLVAIENGKDVRVSTLYKIAKAMGVDIKEFFE